MKNLNLFTSECVTEGHPDKVADQISDAVLDACLSNDCKSHVACETMVTEDKVFIAGEITTKSVFNLENLVRKTIKEIGYDKEGIGFKYDTCQISNNIHKQSSDINAGVSEREDKMTGAGDQGLMFGYATNETEAYMPYPIYYARLLSNKLTEYGLKNSYYRPDGKTQVTYDYTNNKIANVVLSTMHSSEISLEDLRKDIKENIIFPIVGELPEESILINPCGQFVTGGPAGDTGLTGRKIIVDTYGGMARHGGGAFSGKDPSKVDRSAAYMMRYIAKNVVAQGLCDKCEIQVAYAIGYPYPISILVNTFDTAKGISEKEIAERIGKCFDLTPDGIMNKLHLTDSNYIKYLNTAKYGHFGDFNYPWEKVDVSENI